LKREAHGGKRSQYRDRGLCPQLTSLNRGLLFLGANVQREVSKDLGDFQTRGGKGKKRNTRGGARNTAGATTTAKRTNQKKKKEHQTHQRETIRRLEGYLCGLAGGSPVLDRLGGRVVKRVH